MMKNFKENAMMQELNLQEMKDVNGGIAPFVVLGAKWLIGALVSGFALEVICDADQAAKDFQEGYNEVRN